MREPKDDDIVVDLEGVGQFRYAQRTYGDRIALRREYLRVLGDSLRFDTDPETGEQVEKVDAESAAIASIISVHRVLCTGAPDGWEDLEKLSLVRYPDAEVKVFALWSALRDAEERFRKTQK